MELPDNIGIHIVSFMPVTSYLTFRRVSRKSKTWADELGITSLSLKNHPIEWSSNRSVRIMEDGCDTAPSATIQEYLDSRLLISNFQFVNTLKNAHSMFQHPLMPSFLSKFSKRIVRLSVTSFNACEIAGELEFYEKLINLRELEIQSMNVNTYEWKELKRQIPSTFRNLVHLNIGYYHDNRHHVRLDNAFYHLFQIFSHCQNLSKLIMPCTDMLYGFCDSFLKNFRTVILDRDVKLVISEFPSSRIMELDIENMMEELYGYLPTVLRSLLVLCKDRDIYVRNVHSNLYKCIVPLESWDEEPWTFYDADRILSIIDIIPETRKLQLDALEKVKIKSTAKSSIREINQGGLDNETNTNKNCGPIWPNLKRLDIFFDSTSGSSIEILNLGPLCSFLLEQYLRPSVVILILGFEIDYNPGVNLMQSRFLRPESIVKNFIGLKVLELTNWEGLNKSFVKLWEGLCLLEKLTIDGCKLLGNVGFIGENEQSPVFLKLTKLRQLELLCLEKMPKITDRFFRDVLQQMEIQQFKITSQGPSEKISSAGIGVLAERGNPFSSSIRKVSFPKDPFWKNVAQQFSYVAD